MSENLIVIGNEVGSPIFSFDNHAIRSISMVNGVDIVGAELTIDQLTPVVDYAYTSDSAEIIAGPDFDGIMSSDGYLMATARTYDDVRGIPYGTQIRYYRDGSLWCKAYIKSAERLSSQTYRIDAMSPIGLLDALRHVGKVYRGEAFESVLAEIIGGIVPYTLADNLIGMPVYGWLPYDTRRRNLHQLLFAFGVMVARNDDGDMHFCFLADHSQTFTPIDSPVYMNGSVDHSATVTAVDITEHAFVALDDDEVVTLYDNTDGSEIADNTFVAFTEAPIHDLAATATLTIVESGDNWAIVSGSGILTGKRYTHMTRVLTRTREDATDQRENVASVGECTLVSLVNSENVAKRVLSYYSSRQTVNIGLVMSGERPGDMFEGVNPYKEPMRGVLASVTSNISATVKGQCKIITDYVPVKGGNNFSSSVLYTGAGSIDFEALVANKEDDLVQVFLIAGGHGGYSGADGGEGTPGEFSTYGTPGDGGEGGLPGEGGKVYSKTFRVSELPQKVLSFACGAGGASDTPGEATTLGGWTSDDGFVPMYGISDIFTGEIYAATGEDKGRDGGAGSGNSSTGPDITYGGQTWHPGTRGASSSGSMGGGKTRYGTGGFGGGAAVGAHGGNGANSEQGYATRGGSGANAQGGADATRYGTGGSGGHGGGGAGVGGITREESDIGGDWYTPSPNGPPGVGGPGGRGGPGAILILK